MNSKRTHLSLEIKHFIVLEKKRRPKISQTELVWEVNRKFGVSTSRRAIRTALNSKNIIEAAMVNATKAGKNERELSRRSGLILNHFWIRPWKKNFETKSKCWCRKNCSWKFAQRSSKGGKKQLWQKDSVWTSNWWTRTQRKNFCCELH